MKINVKKIMTKEKKQNINKMDKRKRQLMVLKKRRQKNMII